MRCTLPRQGRVAPLTFLEAVTSKALSRYPELRSDVCPAADEMANWPSVHSSRNQLRFHSSRTAAAAA